MNDLTKTIVQASDIPSIPHVLQQILSLADNPNTSSSDLEKFVTQEPGLVSHLLQLVNSAYYGLRQKISSIKHAMILVGFSTVKSVASGLILIDTFENLNGLKQEYVQEVWRHSLISAHLMTLLARKEPVEKKDDFFLAAMIHDVGHLILSQYFREKYDTLITTELFPSAEEEQKLFETNHASIGSALLQEWNFPDRVVELVKNHHSPKNYPGSSKDIAYLVLSDTLVKSQTDMQTFLDQDQSSVSPALNQMFDDVGWNWPHFQQEKKTILEAISSVEKLLAQKQHA